MTIQKETEASQVTLKLVGRLDTITAPSLETELKSAIPAATKLVLDYTGIEYISSAGLRVLLSAQKIMSRQGKMIVKNPNATVMEIFEMTGFRDILHIE